MSEGEVYGASMPLFEKLRLLSEWMPLLGRMQAIASATTPHDQAMAVVSAAQWAAGKTDMSIDDEALWHIEAVLKTPEGRAAFEWIVKKFSEAM